MVSICDTTSARGSASEMPARGLRGLLLLVAVTWAYGARVPGKVLATSPSIPATPTKPPPPAARRAPAVAEGPVALLPLTGRCFSVEVRNYAYELCPFHNATQRDVAATWNPFFGILGIFEGWRYDGDGPAKQYKQQVYTDGTECGAKRRSLTVHLACATSDEYTLSDIKEPATCEYSMTFTCPEVCDADMAVVNGVVAAAPSATPAPSDAPAASVTPSTSAAAAAIASASSSAAPPVHSPTTSVVPPAAGAAAVSQRPAAVTHSAQHSPARGTAVPAASSSFAATASADVARAASAATAVAGGREGAAPLASRAQLQQARDAAVAVVQQLDALLSIHLEPALLQPAAAVTAAVAPA